MKVGVVKETFPGERRVALAPASVAQLTKKGLEVVVQADAGRQAGYLDEQYVEKGAKVVSDRASVLASEILVQVRTLGANPNFGQADLAEYRSPVLIGMCDPLGNPQAIQELAKTGARLFALEMIPRITRAQSMDILSSMATIAGYRAVLLAAVELPKIFPLLMTAAGTVSAARILVIGVGVAGLQAIATAKRLGGVVHAYDVRPACREQVESLGGKFVELDLDAGQSEDKGGYAKAMGEEFYRRQRELLADVIADCDVVVTTAAIPGKTSPLLVTEDAVRRMPAGGVIVDLAAERGGNCELSKPDERVEAHDVVILGPTNLPAEIPQHASQMYSANITKFLLNLCDKDKPGELNINLEDEIIRDTMVAAEGDVPHPRIREMLGLEPLVDDKEIEMEPEIIADAPQASDNTIKVDIYADESDDPPEQSE